MLPIIIFIILFAYLYFMRKPYLRMLDNYSYYSRIDEMPPKPLMRKMWWIERGAVLLILSLFIATYCYLLYLKNHQ